MKLRKIAAVLIAIVVLCAAVPNVAFAQDNFSFATAKTISPVSYTHLTLPTTSFV